MGVGRPADELVLKHHEKIHQLVDAAVFLYLVAPGPVITHEIALNQVVKNFAQVPVVLDAQLICNLFAGQSRFLLAKGVYNGNMPFGISKERTEKALEFVPQFSIWRKEQPINALRTTFAGLQ